MYVKRKIRCIFVILYSFISEKGNAVQTAKEELCAGYGDGSIAEDIIYKLFARFRGYFDFGNRELSSRLAVIDVDQIETLFIIQLTLHGASQRYDTYLI